MSENMLAALTSAASSVQSRPQNRDADTPPGDGSTFKQVLESDTDIAEPIAIAHTDMALTPHTDSNRIINADYAALATNSNALSTSTALPTATAESIAIEVRPAPSPQMSRDIVPETRATLSVAPESLGRAGIDSAIPAGGTQSIIGEPTQNQLIRDPQAGLNPSAEPHKAIAPEDGRTGIVVAETARFGIGEGSTPVSAQTAAPNAALVDSTVQSSQEHGPLATANTDTAWAEIGQTPNAIRPEKSPDSRGAAISSADQVAPEFSDIQSPLTASQKSTNSPKADPQLERTRLDVDLATPSETRLNLDIEPQIKTPITAAAGAPDSALATASSSLTAASAPVTITANTTPSFNPVATPNTPQPIVASPADIPDVVAQTLAQNESTERITIQLDPPELGRVSIEFQIDDSGVHTVTVTGETSEALRKLRMMNFELLQALEQQGLGDRGFSLEYQNSDDADAWTDLNQDTAGDAEADIDSQTDTWSSDTAHNPRIAARAITADGGLNLRL